MAGRPRGGMYMVWYTLYCVVLAVSTMFWTCGATNTSAQAPRVTHAGVCDQCTVQKGEQDTRVGQLTR